MNNDQQILHLDTRIDRIMAELRVIQGGLYNKLKISEIILEREGVTTKLNITRIYETPDGVVIKVV